MRSRGTPSCSAGTYCVPCAAGAPAPARGAAAGGGGGGAGRAAGAGAEEAGAPSACGCAALPAMSASMSCLVMRPPAPVPSMAERSTPCSLARRRTKGDEWMRSVPEPEAAAAGAGALEAGGAGAGFAAGAGALGAAAAGLAVGAGAGAEAAAEPAPSMTATMVWIGTVWPSGILISFSTPAEGEGISASTLSVEISNRGSSRSTLSPGFLSHLVMVPSKMLSPIWGITTSTAMGLSPRVAELPNPGALLAGGRAEVNRTSLQGKAARRKVRCLACIPERLFLETGRRGLEAGQCFGGGEHFLRVGEEGFLEGRSVGD